MSPDYTPDNWVLLKITRLNEEPLYKLLSGWKGGYTQGDDWRLSSGVTEVIDKEHFYTIVNYSGSVYRCYKRSEGLMGITSSILDKLQRNSFEQDAEVQIINAEDFYEKQV
jgi:hypothetical protein